MLLAGLARVGFCCWACWARFFIEKKKYTSRYHTFLSIKGFSIGVGQREWVDGSLDDVHLTLIFHFIYMSRSLINCIERGTTPPWV